MRLTQAICDECGWRSKPTTPRRADYAYRQHSCERHRRRREARAAAEARRAAVDRTPKPCPHKRARHEHGTYACYVLDSCRCEPCSAANRDYERNRVRQQAYGRWRGLVDAEPARAHVRALMAEGMGLKRIAAVSGVAHGVLWKLVYGKRRPDGSQRPSRRVKPDVKTRLLAVRHDLADGARVDATGTRRRLQALVTLGWSQAELARRLNVDRGNFVRLMRCGQVRAGTERAVRDLYERLSMRLPQADAHRLRISVARARNHARRVGWLPPLAWDDDTLDNPTAKPSGHPSYLADLLEPVAWYHAKELSDRQIGVLLSRNRETVGRARDVLGLPANRRAANRRADREEVA